MKFARNTAAAALAAAVLSVSPAAAAPDGLVEFVQFGSGSRQQGELTLRISRLEEQIRQLNGQIEQMAHQMRQLQEQMRRMQEDNEFRLQQLEGSAPRRQNFEGQAPAGAERQRDAGVSDPATTGSIGSSGGTGPLDLSALARGDILNPPASSALPGVPTYTDAPSASSTAEYEAAYGLIMAGRYGEAEDAFRTFLMQHPDDPRAGDAQFWIGEALLQSGQHSAAADAFLKSYTDYPDGDKAPDSLLKLGIALSGMGESSAACSSFSELLSSYPAADPSLLDRARQERQRAGCA